jgi:hypothetical protein
MKVHYLLFFTDTDFFQLFPKKDLKDGGQTKTDGKSVSKLTLLVKNSHNQPKNPFAHYGKFDGEVWQKLLFFLETPKFV